MNEYLNQYEKRKEEQNARRFQMLFLKRLENDGCKVSISKADRELLRNFGKVEEEKAVIELQKAINADAGFALTEEEKLFSTMNANGNKDDSAIEFNKDARRNPESALEKLQVKRMKAICAETKAVSNQIYSSKTSSKIGRGHKS